LKKVTENHKVRRAAIAILNYLRNHPLAKDSAKGIAQWWVQEEREVVEKALALLREEMVVEKRGHVYQLVQNKPMPENSASLEKALRRLHRKK
jgi:peroxiredoxin